MNHFINQSNGSHCGHSLMGRAMLRRFALFPMMLLMLLLLPAGMVAQKAASSSKYIATYDSESETLTFEKYEGESLPSESEWVEDGTSVFDMFKYDCQNIKNIVINESFKTFTPTTLSRFFGGLVKLETITGLEYLNTANVTNMYRMFNSCGLTSLDLSNFNTAKVENMGLMFSACSNLKTIYASDKFITAAVTESKNMFSYCDSLSGDINWTSDKANDKTYAKIDGGYFRDKAYDNRPWVKYADGTLTFYCGYKKTLGENEYELNSGEEPPAWNTNKIKITRVVFEASFANARPTTCYAWFKTFYNLEQIEGIENLNTVNVTSMSSMFWSCVGLTSLDVTNFNTANVTDMKYMFSNCYSLTTIYVSDEFVTDKVTKGSYMFKDCTNLKGAITEYDESKTDYHFANYKTGYFTKLVGKNGDEKIGATGETLATDNLVLDDDKDFVAYEPFTAKAASYCRTINAGTKWATLCLPFEVSLAVGIVALNLGIHCVESIVVAALTIFGLVIEGRAFYLYFARREVALEVLHIGGCVPEAPFGKGEYLEGLHLLRLVLQRHLLHFCPGVQWHEEEHTCLHAVLAARDAGIVHAVAALVAVERCLARFPSRVPYGIAIFDIEIATDVIHRHTIVAITGDATELGILVERITTCCI